MKKLLIAAMIAGLACSCAKDEPAQTPETDIVIGQPEWDDTITISFARPYEITPMGSPRTRTATSIATICTHLDVWIINGTDTTSVHQSSTDAGFGTVQAVLDKRKTYQLYAVAHKCDGDATLADGIIAFPDDKVTHSMIYTGSVSPATAATLSAEMTRIVGQFRLETTDAIPDEAKKMRFTITDVWNRWNVSTGATNKLDRTSEMNISSKKADGTAIFSVYAITSDAETTHTVTISALDANDQPIQSRTFSGVKLRNGYRTTYKGAFFIDADFSSSFTIDDWNDYDTVDF